MSINIMKCRPPRFCDANNRDQRGRSAHHCSVFCVQLYSKSGWDDANKKITVNIRAASTIGRVAGRSARIYGLDILPRQPRRSQAGIWNLLNFKEGKNSKQFFSSSSLCFHVCWLLQQSWLLLWQKWKWVLISQVAFMASASAMCIAALTHNSAQTNLAESKTIQCNPTQFSSLLFCYTFRSRKCSQP